MGVVGEWVFRNGWVEKWVWKMGVGKWVSWKWV